jgi:hypothetical protein
MRLKHFATLLVLSAVLLAALLTLAAPAAPAQASGIVSVCDEASLRAALDGGGTVTFSCSGTITLTATITIAADTTIDGSGQAVTISGNHAVRVFTVNSGGTLNLNALTIADGSIIGGDGGGIYNSGSLTVTDSTFFGNSAASASYVGGGGIYTRYPGTLSVSDSTFSGNGVQACGGIYNGSGSATVSDSTFSGNGAWEGGGICNSGTLTVTNTTFSGNSATNGGGGGIANLEYGTLTVGNSTFSGNTATGGGGGISNSGTLTVTNTTFSGNSVDCGGGGISNSSGMLTVINTTFSDNTAIGGDPGGGGGIRNYNGSVTVSNSAFSGNTTAGAGGGIHNYFGTVTVSNSTFSGNSAANFGGGIYNHNSGSVETTFKNTIVANSPSGSNCSGTITDGGGNLSYPDTTCPGINSDPKLGALQDNGGPTWTMALLPGSAAIDAGNDAICAAPPVSGLDQRGVARPQRPRCDIGAYEALPPRAILPIILR